MTNFADLAAHYWGRMRHWESRVTQRDIHLAQQADVLATKRYARRKPDDWDRAVYAIECELVDTDRERSVLVGRQQFAQRMHDSCVLQALMRHHEPTFELDVTLDLTASRGLAATRVRPDLSVAADGYDAVNDAAAEAEADNYDIGWVTTVPGS